MSKKREGTINTPITYDVLKWIDEHGWTKASDMYNVLAVHNTIDDRLEFLLGRDLIESKMVESGRMHKEYHITPKGKAYILTLMVAVSIDDDRIDIDNCEIVETMHSILKRCR